MQRVTNKNSNNEKKKNDLKITKTITFPIISHQSIKTIQE